MTVFESCSLKFRVVELANSISLIKTHLAENLKADIALSF